MQLIGQNFVNSVKLMEAAHLINDLIFI